MTALLCCLAVVAVLQVLTMIKLSELAGNVAALNNKADAILSKLPALTDPPIPAAAEENIAALAGKLDSIDASIPAPPPAVV